MQTSRLQTSQKGQFRHCQQLNMKMTRRHSDQQVCITFDTKLVGERFKEFIFSTDEANATTFASIIHPSGTPYQYYNEMKRNNRGITKIIYQIIIYKFIPISEY